MKEAGKETGWNISIEEEEDNIIKETTKEKEELNQRSEQKDENNNKENMTKKVEKITDEDNDKRKSSKEREQKFRNLQERAKELGIDITDMSTNALNEAIKEKEAEEEKKEGKEEKGEKKKSPELGKKLEEEKRKKTELRKSEIYKRFYDKERFGIDKDTIKSIQGILEEQMKDILVRQGKKWLKEQKRNYPDEYPELARQDIDEFDETKIMDCIRDKNEFWSLLDKEDKEWKDAENLRESIEYFEEVGEGIPPDIKTTIFKRLPEGLIKEKVWEKLVGENLDEKAKIEPSIEEASIGEKNDYVEKGIKAFETEERNKFFQEEWDKLSPVKQRAIGSIDDYAQSRIDYLKETLNKNLKGLKTIEESDIFALLKQEISPNGIEKIEKARKFPGTEEKIKVKGIKGKMKMTEFEEIIETGDKSRTEEINEMKSTEEGNWETKFKNQKSKILKNESEKTTDEIIEKCYEKIGRDVAARELSKEIDKDPKRKAKIEKEFGKGEEGKENIKREFTKLIKKDEELEGEWGEDEEDLEKILENWGIEPKKLTDKQKETYKEFSEKKWGLIDWILAIMFSKI